ncbi:MAG: hypothetical protein AB9869_08015 [Verrucomicrobiia bacterium]
MKNQVIVSPFFEADPNIRKMLNRARDEPQSTLYPAVRREAPLAERTGLR